MTAATNQSFADAHRVYQESGIGERSGLGARWAVVVVDLQRGFTERDSGVGGDLSLVINAVNTLTETARANTLPVAFTVVGFQNGVNPTWLRKMPGLAVLREGTTFCDLDPRVIRSPDEPLWTKQASSAFFGTSLQTHLTSLAVDTLIVTGCVTSGCIRATVIDAVSLGYRVVVPFECVGDRDEVVHQANLFDIDAKYGDVLPLSELLTEFEGRQVAR